MPEEKTTATKTAVERLLNNAADLLKVRSLITLIMTAGLLYMICSGQTVPDALLAIYSTAYGAVITYFFTRKENTAA